MIYICMKYNCTVANLQRNFWWGGKVISGY